MGFVATEMLIKLISGEELETRIHKIPTQLIIRASCCALDTGWEGKVNSND
jgi:DNA-binding LacI/PurR family transcriptional regulator